ncbi:hypothetical protein [Haloglomus litoreum]|uniref:hypothetical protein n=1 Tax=Haloglomus litoreum TaxID=3034026 RepID=UPI0023E8125D|nr:hypothetical protein [Haloglomus sp. DT116]
MSIVERVRKPEYTGENRCIPCTLANSVIAVVLAAVVGAAWWVLVGTVTGGAVVAAVVLVASALSIWLRGYLVPGTPELTKRYFPDWLLAKFDKGPAAAGGMAAGAGGAAGDGTDDERELQGQVNSEAVLLEAGVVEPCADEDDLCLSPAFRGSWRDRMGTIREEGAERAELANQLDLDPEEVRFEEHGGAFVAFYDGRRAGQWESRAALIADLAAARVLPEWVGGWDDLAIGARSQLLGGLRIFIDECPDCSGPVVAGRETVESCCRSHEVVAANCQECGSRLLELPYEEPATPGGPGGDPTLSD